MYLCMCTFVCICVCVCVSTASESPGTAQDLASRLLMPGFPSTVGSPQLEPQLLLRKAGAQRLVGKGAQKTSKAFGECRRVSEVTLSRAPWPLALAEAGGRSRWIFVMRGTVRSSRDAGHTRSLFKDSSRVLEGGHPHVQAMQVLRNVAHRPQPPYEHVCNYTRMYIHKPVITYIHTVFVRLLAQEHLSEYIKQYDVLFL